MNQNNKIVAAKKRKEHENEKQILCALCVLSRLNK